MTRQISRERKLEIIRLYRTGIHGNALAKQFGYANSCVYQWLIDADEIEKSIPQEHVESIPLVQQAMRNSPVSVWALGSQA